MDKSMLSRRVLLGLGLGGFAALNFYVFSRRERRPAFEESKQVTSLSFSTCGKLLCYGTADDRVVIFDPSTEKIVSTHTGMHDSAISGIGIHDDDSWAASVDESAGLLKFWSLPDFGEFMFAHFDSTPSAIAFLPRRREGVTPIPAGIVVGTSNGSLSALEIGTKSALTTGHGQRFAEISRAEQESAKIDSIAFMAAGDGFATGSEDGTVRIYRYPELSLEFELSAGHSVNSVSFSGDSRKVVAGLSNGKLLVWKHNGSSFELHRSASPFSAPISSVAFCRDDKIVTVAKSGVVEVLLESKGFARGVELPVSPSRYPAASVSADGNYIAMSWGDDVKCFKTVDILS